MTLSICMLKFPPNPDFLNQFWISPSKLDCSLFPPGSLASPSLSPSGFLLCCFLTQVFNPHIGSSSGYSSNVTSLGKLLLWAEIIGPLLCLGCASPPLLPSLVIHPADTAQRRVHSYHVISHLALDTSVFPDQPAASGWGCVPASLCLPCLAQLPVHGKCSIWVERS